MGTRNSTIVIDKKGKTKIFQYGQFDGYPSGQGITILRFLLECDLVKFEKQLKKCRFTNDADAIEKMCDEEGDKWDIVYPQFSRNTAAKILEYVYDYPDDDLLLDHSDNSVRWCEWIYVINIKKGALEIYQEYETIFDIYPLNNLPTEEQFIRNLEYDEDEEAHLEKKRKVRLKLFGREKKLERILG